MWSAPANNGGGAITRYEVSINNGAWMQAQSSTSHTFTNLMDMNYSFRVRAVNSAGGGAVASASARPNPSEPTLTGAMAGLTHNSATITGNITNAGGGAVNRWGAWHRRTVDSWETETNANSVSGNWFSVTISNLVPNTAYVGRAVARNTHFPNHTGQSGILSFTTLNPPATVPSVPRTPNATSPSAGRANLTWQIPASDGGSWIMRYEVSANNGPWVFAQSSTWHNFENLPGGLNTFRIRAINAVGASPIATTSVTVQAPPQTVTFSYTSVGHTSGSPPASHSINIPGTITLQQPGMLRVGFTFGGWSDGNDVFAAGQSFNFATGVTRTITFTAVWNPVVLTQVNVTLDPNGGEFVTPRGMAEELDAEAFEEMDFETADLNIEIMPLSRLPFIHVAAVGSLATQLPVVEKNGYTFIGWFTTPTGISGSQVVRMEIAHHNRTLFAVWQRNPIITSPVVDMEIVSLGALHVTWEALANAVYRLTLRNTTTQQIIINQQVGGTSFTIHAHHLVEGDDYELVVTATTSPNNWVSSSSREFTVGQPPGIMVTVMRGGWPVSGAYVQFIHGGNVSNNAPAIERNNVTFVTDASGVAFFPNAPNRNYRINVTHPNLVSNRDTSILLTRNAQSPRIQNEVVVMGAPNDTLRALNWVDVLPTTFPNSDIVYEQPRISSVFGHRFFRSSSTWSWHRGIDLVSATEGNARNRRIASAFTGTLARVDHNEDFRGYSITARFFDVDNGIFYFAEYQHMIAIPQVIRNGVATNITIATELRAGEVIGRIGNTGDSQADHLHFGVFWNNVNDFRRNDDHVMDPRAFFPHDFALPWNDLNVIR